MILCEVKAKQPLTSLLFEVVIFRSNAFKHYMDLNYGYELPVLADTKAGATKNHGKDYI